MTKSLFRNQSNSGPLEFCDKCLVAGYLPPSQLHDVADPFDHRGDRFISLATTPLLLRHLVNRTGPLL